jgi:hypothetical protein
MLMIQISPAFGKSTAVRGQISDGFARQRTLGQQWQSSIFQVRIFRRLLMSWFTGNPWPLVLLLISAAVIGVVLQLRRCWQLAAGLLLSAAAVYVLESQIVTVPEQLEQRLDGIRLAFVHDDLAEIRSFI